MNLKKLVIVIVVLVNLTEIRAADDSKNLPELRRQGKDIDIEALKQSMRASLLKEQGKEVLTAKESDMLDRAMRPAVINMAMQIRAQRVEGHENAHNLPVSVEDVKKAVIIVETLELLENLEEDGAAEKRSQ